MFIDLVKKSFLDVVKNPIIALFLVLYFIIFSLLAGCLGTQSNLVIWLMLAFSTFLFIAIFTAGWLRIIKEIALKDPNKAREKTYVGMFFESVGENVIPVFVGLIIYIIFSMVFVYFAFLISIKFFGNPQEIIMQAQASPDIIAFINSLPQEELEKLYAFPILFMISTAVCAFLFMYYFPSIIFSEKKNVFLKAFISLKDNFCFLFKHFFKSILIFLFIFMIYAGFSIARSLCVFYLHDYRLVMEILAILSILFIIYFLSFSIMLICNYYGKQNSCNNRPDGIGENKSDDSVGKED